MVPKWLQAFLCSAGVILLGTGVAKVISSVTGGPVLSTNDPVFGVTLRWLFGVTGVLEVTIALICVFHRHVAFSTVLVLWLSASFLVYRIGWRWLGGASYCSCLGTMTEQLHLDPAAADLALKLALAYLLLGSAFALWMIQKRHGVRGLLVG